MWEALGGRKFLLALVILAVGTVVQLKSDHGVTESFTALLIGIMGVFGASNAMVSIKGMQAQSPDEPEAPALATATVAPAAPAQTIDLEPVTQALGSIQGQLGQLQEATLAHAQSIQVLHEGVASAQKLAKAAVSIR